MIKLIVAVDQSNSIGHGDGRLPWAIPSDMARFKTLTTGGTVVMGRKTFDSLRLPAGLPDRRNIVLTHQPISGVETALGLDWVARSGDAIPGKDLWIIGGASVYDQALKLQIVDKLYVTMVECNSGADVRLAFELYYYQLFILSQQKNLGITWVLEDKGGTPPNPESGTPGTNYITLTRVNC